MLTIVEPKEHIAKLWGKQRIRETENYRLMKYTLKVKYNDRVLLHNVVTGQLVVLNEDEAQCLEMLSSGGKFAAGMKEMIAEHFVVPEDYDEYQQVVKLRSILRKLDDAQRSSDIIYFTILPTTACNAKCYYCFEKGTAVTTMSAETANEVVDYIYHSSGNKKVSIIWFGGEPTLAENRIDQICKGLCEKGIDYSSSMTTNGYLFDEEMVVKAKSLWRLRYVQVSFDGIENNHNKTKNFINARDNPYNRTLRNIGLLLKQDIHVGIRMNFDLYNQDDFKELVNEAYKMFHGDSKLSVYAHPINGEHMNDEGHIVHGSDLWFSDKIEELNSYSRTVGTYHEHNRLPSIEYRCCFADNVAAITITPEGNLTRCCECIAADDWVGSVKNGITRINRYKLWDQIAYYTKCKDCEYFPFCIRIEKCPAKDRCQFRSDWHKLHMKRIEEFAKSSK